MIYWFNNDRITIQFYTTKERQKMEVRKPAKFLLIIAILFYLLSAVMLYKGYDKMTNLTK